MKTISFSQTGYEFQLNSTFKDSSLAEEYYLKAQNQLKSEQLDSAEINAKQSLKYSIHINNPLLDAKNYWLMAQISKQKPDSEITTIKYLVSAEGAFASINDQHNLIRIYSEIAEQYIKIQGYEKSLEYFNKALSIPDIYSNNKTKSNLLEDAGFAAFKALKYDSSIVFFQESYEISIELNKQEAALRNLFNLIKVFESKEDYQSALLTSRKMFDIYKNNGDKRSMYLTMNNIGYLQIKLNHYLAALESFHNNLELFSNTGFLSKREKSQLYSNIAICYQNLDKTDQTIEHFILAIEVYKHAKDFSLSPEDYAELARLQNLTAIAYKIKMDLYHAEIYSHKSIESAEKSGSSILKQKCYKTYSEILKEGNDFINALNYYEKYLNLRDSLSLEKRVEEEKLNRKMYELEKSEKELKLARAEKEKQALAINQLRLQLSKEEQEKELLRREKELDLLDKQKIQLERDKILQSLQLNQKQHEAEALEQENRIKGLQLEQEKAETREKEKQNQLLESKNRAQQLEIEKQKLAKRRSMMMIAMVAIVSILIFIFLLSTIRKNRLLATQKVEIEAKNKDLEQKNEEISSQKEEIVSINEQLIIQKDLIEEKNKSITDSIQYASRIQTAVLPPKNVFWEELPDHFIFFKPRDIVSGDFYWSAKKNKKLYIAAADCTGHGVPGAFMSMLGTAFLNEIVSNNMISGADQVLIELRKNIIEALRQKGTEGEQKDGMDIALCIIDFEQNILEFSGANNPLYFIRKEQIEKIEADRMPIGIHSKSNMPFSKKEINTKPEDRFYIFSDGFADQFGGPDGKKYKYKPFQEFLLSIHKNSMLKQEELLDNEFNNWKGKHEQIDDILIIGFKIP